MPPADCRCTACPRGRRTRRRSGATGAPGGRSGGRPRGRGRRATRRSAAGGTATRASGPRRRRVSRPAPRRVWFHARSCAPPPTHRIADQGQTGAGNMAGTVTWDLLRELAGFRAERGCAVSLYLNLDPSEVPTAPALETRVNSLLAEAERRMDASKGELSRDAREGLKADLERIRRWFDDEFDRDGSQGAAVFASGPDNFWSAHNLPEPVPDGVRVNKQLYLAPLVRLVGSGDGALVAFVGRERGQVFRMRGGRLVEVADRTEDTPGQHDQGGWSQARYERHIETLVDRHLKRVAETLDGCVRRMRGVHVVLVGSGSEDIRSDFEAVLSNDVKERLVGWTHAEAHATPAELLHASEPMLEGVRDG